DGLEIIYLLLDAVLEDLKILLLQARDKPAVTIEHRYRHRHEICLDFDDPAIVIRRRRRLRIRRGFLRTAYQYRRFVVWGLDRVRVVFDYRRCCGRSNTRA